jgi:hypothetical protein
VLEVDISMVVRLKRGGVGVLKGRCEVVVRPSTGRGRTMASETKRIIIDMKDTKDNESSTSCWLVVTEVQVVNRWALESCNVSVQGWLKRATRALSD